MNIKAPVGKCQYCGQEFMTKTGLKNHEKDHCPMRLKAEPEAHEQHWKQAVQNGRTIGWMRK